MAKTFQVRRAPDLTLLIRQVVARIMRRIAADECPNLTPDEIERRYKLFLECGF